MQTSAMRHVANLSHAPSMQDKENQRHAGERILQQQKPVQIKEV
jgi:hypothetical protein